MYSDHLADFPVGAVTVTEMMKNGELSQKQSGLLLAACHAPGPMFIIGFVGTELFGDVSSGWKLLAAIHIANILFFLLAVAFLHTRKRYRNHHFTTPKKVKGMPLLDAIKESSTIIILVATTVIFFSSLGTVLSTVFTSAFHSGDGNCKNICLSHFRNDIRRSIRNRSLLRLADFPISYRRNHFHERIEYPYASFCHRKDLQYLDDPLRNRTNLECHSRSGYLLFIY